MTALRHGNDPSSTPSAHASETSDALLQVRDLKTWFETDRGLFRAVDGISLDVPRVSRLSVSWVSRAAARA